MESVLGAVEVVGVDPCSTGILLRHGDLGLADFHPVGLSGFLVETVAEAAETAPTAEDTEVEGGDE